jgi:hypothetical protein
MKFRLRRNVFRALDRFPPVRARLIDPVRQAMRQEERDRVARDYFELIRGSHQGQRGFVIGNGPSLKMGDLTRLLGEVTIASNLIHLAYAATEWRPTYVTVIDELVWNKMAKEAHHHYFSVFIASGLEPAMAKCLSYQIRDIGHAPVVRGRIAFSSDLSEGVYGGSTVTYTNLQLARHLGLNPVYLIGCDHYYNEPSDAKELVPIADSGNNHFAPDYRQPGELVNPAPIANMTKSFEVAQVYCDMSDFRIFNATRGGFLEAFPRCEFDDLVR